MRLRRRPTVAVLSALALLVLAARAHALPAAKAGSGGEAPRDSVQQAQVGGALWDRVQADQLGEALLGETYRDACPAATAGHARCFARLATSVLPDAASAPVSAAASGSAVRGYGPADLRSAYALPSTTRGAGQTVAIVAAFDHPDAESDLAHYRSFFGLPSCTRANGCFRKVNQRGGSTPPRADAGWAQEISLDLDMVSAVCPRCHLLLVEADSNSLANLGAAVSRAASMGAKVISNSYGAPESQGLRNANAAFNHPGHVLTAAAGDSGFGLSFPASSQYVTAVGGTRLTRSSNARGWTESVWSGTGSGCSRVFPKPSWQTDGGCSGRTVADVSAVADPATGVAMYHTFGVRGGPWFKAGGTSVSAPIIAGVYALAGNAGSVRYGSFPYSHTGALHDVTSGANGSCGGSYLCTAMRGYDGPSGLGTPNGSGAF
jgi:Subtilase family